jgi:hypothetical protein
LAGIGGVILALMAVGLLVLVMAGSERSRYQKFWARMAPEFYCCPTLWVGRLLVGSFCYVVESFCSVDKTIWDVRDVRKVLWEGRMGRRGGGVGDGEDPEAVAEEVAR